jgi:gliding motility-associated-like protein
MLTKIVLFVQCILISALTYAQIDREFWFAAPDVYDNAANFDRPIVVRLSTFSSPATVTISIPANPSFTPIVVNIPASSTNTVDLTNWIDQIENSPVNTANNKGLLVQSTADITAYYEVVSSYCMCNPEIFSLKGKNALGNEFYISSQYTYDIDTVRFPPANTSFEIVATQNNTTVNVTPTKELIGHPAGIPFTITLNAGQTYSCVGKFRNKENHLQGSYVSSDKPIAVTLKGDLTLGDGSCADLIGDQTIPTNVLGNEYIVTKGYLVPGDRVFILAAEDNASIFVDGNAAPSQILAKGQSWTYSLLNTSTYIRSDKKIYVYQVTGNGCELGSAIIPKLNCTGSQSVSIVRSTNETFAVMLTAKNGTQNSFTVNGNPSLITAANFSPVPGTGGNYVAARVDLSGSMAVGNPVNISNGAGKFSLGFINGSPVGGCRYGFFSDFKSSNVQRSQTEMCAGDSTQLTAFGGVTYQWSPSTGLSNTGIANPKASPAVTTEYKVTITDANGCVDSAFVKVVVDNCSLSCDNWLNLPSAPSYADIGELDVPGHTITVEAMINRTTPYSGGPSYAGDVVSKHNSPSDANYLLRPGSAEITTTNGYFKTPDICPIDLNKTYHVAMTYDGQTLKFYRDGFLMSQVAATGDLVQNNWHTRIGLLQTGATNENFIGYINEVRIWNVARTQTDIKTYMNTSLPSPSTQAGLLAYYTYGNLLNRQGNATLNTTLGGNATINATNPNCSYTPDSCQKVTAGFLTPDTVCISTPVTINNTSSGATTYYWNFCVADINGAPVGVNIGNPGNLLNAPVFLDYVYTNNNYYGFVTNYNSDNLIRLDFGNSLLNTPVATNLGNYGGILQPSNATEGIQVVQNEGKWYVFIVGGTPIGGTIPRLVKIELGTSITNPGVATGYDNLGNMNQPIDLHVFNENGNWYGFTVNAENNTITRFNFTNSFNNTPTAVNLGNIGSLAYPTGIYAVNDNGFWRVFITNGGDNQRIGTNSSITRLDFGNSLLNTPTGVNLGNPGGQLHHPRDFTIMKFCGQIIGFAVNGNPNYNNIVRLNFNNDLTTAPSITTVGNIGNLNFPHSISKLFRVNDNVYTFITNVANNTITRLQFQGCTNASVSSSNLQNPAPVTYNTPGTYNINLTIDDGLPTQTSICRQVVVLPAPVHAPTKTINLCTGDSLKIGSGVKYAKYTWNTGANTDSVFAKTSDTYWVQADLYGCSNRDSFVVNNIVKPVVQLGADTSVCSFTNFILNAGNTGATYLWQDGSTNQTFTVNNYGKYYVKVTNSNGCTGSDTIRVSLLASLADFHYKQDVCNPLAIQFFSDGSSMVNPYWSFGNGNTTTGNFNPAYTYTAYGNYTVKFGVQVGNCKDTIIKIIPVNVVNSNIIITPDTTICINAGKQLRTLPAFNFCWSPATWLDNPDSPNPVTTTPANITYYFTAQVPGDNLIQNGDFSSGNTGFTSDYTFDVSGIPAGVYAVGNNPNAWHPNFPACKDHTTGSGNMMLVNGASTPDSRIWSETISVTPNTNYAFSTWLQSLDPINPAQLQFSINSHTIGSTFQASSVNCTWNQFYTIWNSGNTTSATISIVNQNTQYDGNDFALDDISFAPVLIKRDSVIITVDTPLVKTINDTTVCTNGLVQLNTSGANTWSWLPVSGLSNAAIGNPTATITNNIEYIVTGINQYGCTAKDTVDISVFPVPVVLSDHHIYACPNTPVQLSANNSLISYAWSPAATLNNTTIANPMAMPAKPTVYTVQVTDAHHCNYSDSVDVSVHPIRFTTSFNQEICQGSSVVLKAKGGDTYQWNPAGSLDNTTSATVVATPDTSTMYSVYMAENACGHDTTMYINVKVKPSPVVSVQKTNDINCSSPSAKLSASGADAYLWFPATGLDNPAISNPVAGADTTTTYYVQGTNQFGCSDTAAVTVYVTAAGKVSFVVPNAFTPNGDGRNDCFSIKSWGGAVIEEFSVFNRWGQKVFTSNNPNQCWDGRYKGQPMESGGYAYVIVAKTICGTIKRTGVVMLLR